MASLAQNEKASIFSRIVSFVEKQFCDGLMQ